MPNRKRTRAIARAIAALVVMSPVAARADKPGTEIVRMGGDAAVPRPELGNGAPLDVLVMPAGGPAIARTAGGGFVTWDAGSGTAVVLPLGGERLLAASPNGGSLLTGTQDGRVVRSRVDSWQPITELSVEGAVEAATFSSDGHHVIVASQGARGRRFTLFGGAIGLALQRIDRKDAPLGAPIAASTTRFAFIAKQDRAIALYSIPRFTPLREVPLDSETPIRALAFASETELVGVHEGKLRRWDTDTSKVLSEVAIPVPCSRLALSANGQLALCAPRSDKGEPVIATLLETDGGQVRTTFLAPGRGQPAFDPNGLRVAFPGNAAVPVWEVTIDGVTTTLPPGAMAGRVHQLVVVAGTVVARESGLVRAWDPATRAEAWRVRSDATSIARVGGDRLALAGPSGLAVYDPADGELQVIDGRTRYTAVAAGHSGDLVGLLDAQGRVWVRELGDKRSLAAMPRWGRGRVASGVLALAWDAGWIFAEGRLASLPPMRRPKAELVARDARLAAWMDERLVVVEGDDVRVVGAALQFSRPGLVSLAASPDGRWLAVGTRDGKVALYDDGGALRFESVVHNGPVSALAFDLETHRVYAAGEDGEQGLILGLSLP